MLAVDQLYTVTVQSVAWPEHSWLQQQVEGQAFVFNEKIPLNPIKTVKRQTSQISYKIVAFNCTIAMVAFYPSAIDSDYIEPLSVLHSKLKFEW